MSGMNMAIKNFTACFTGLWHFANVETNQFALSHMKPINFVIKLQI